MLRVLIYKITNQSTLRWITCPIGTLAYKYSHQNEWCQMTVTTHASLQRHEFIPNV